MASQSYIIQLDDALITVRETVQNIQTSLARERKSNEGYVPVANPAHRTHVTASLLNRENRDCWGKLHVNACALRRELDKAIVSLELEFKP